MTMALGCDSDISECGHPASHWEQSFELATDCTGGAVVVVEIQDVRRKSNDAHAGTVRYGLRGEVAATEGVPFWSDAVFNVAQCHDGDADTPVVYLSMDDPTQHTCVLALPFEGPVTVDAECSVPPDDEVCTITATRQLD